MIQMRAVQVSYGDNHQVHLETHAQIMDLPQFAMYPKVVQQLFEQHMKDHVAAMKLLLSSPGLIPNDQIGIPNQPNLTPESVKPPQPKPGTDPNQAPDIKKGQMQQQAPAQAPAQPAPQPVQPPAKPAVSTTPLKPVNIKSGKKALSKT